MLNFLMRKMPKQRQFEFKPRYYDAHKEHFNQRKRWIEIQMENENRKLPNHLEVSYKTLSFRKRRKENINVIGLRMSILILCLLSIWYFMT